ncbi:MAG: cell wall-active antibiotics response protein [Bacteroidia bacterium]|nr:cell wall-active antibiotics response protein [Bacteroidia bacterium]
MNEHRHRPRQTNVWLGLIILTAGFFLLVDRLDIILFPHWLFSWPMAVLVVGFLIGIKKRFNGVGWLIMMLFGSLMLAQEWTGERFVHQYGLPLGVIVLGAFLVFRSLSNRTADHNEGAYRRNWTKDDPNVARSTQVFGSDEGTGNTGGGEEFVDLTSVFGSTKRRIFAKNFKGGDITSIFGGAELDLTQADIEGTVVVDVLQIFGGFELVVPANWEVKSRVTTIFGGVEDNRAGHPASGTSGKN